jgi:hypothetical protein
MKNLIRSGFYGLLTMATLGTQAQVPVMSSYPSASAVIFLDFDGQTVANTSWNYNGPIYCAGANLNNAQITEVFNRVSEDYRPFNVNVTTDSTKYWAAPTTKRMRVILTITSDWYGSAGGVSFVNSFTWGDNTPCFVFTALLNYNVKYIAEAASHEAGHTLGLYHQSKYDANCVKISEYNSGQGAGEIGWAPIMGVGYYQNFTLWNNGPNPYGCNSLQSDLDIITTNNGFSYRTDDYGNTFAAASVTSFTNNQFTLNGVIERSSDVDMFKFTLPSTGRFTLNAIPYNVGTGNAGSDLDMQVTLYNNSQTMLNIYNPGTLLSSVIDTTLLAGNYYLKVEGKGNIYAPNYASLGSYSLQGGFNIGAPLPLRKLELRGSQVDDQHKLSWIIDADEQVVKQFIEVSTDGLNYTILSQPSNNSRSFSYTPLASSTLLYRLNVTFDNGRQYYSNIVTLRQTTAVQKPKLMGNLVTTNSISVSSPGNYSYSVMDITGKIILKGLLTTGINSINTGSMVSGMYIIRFEDGTRQWTEKLMRQ